MCATISVYFSFGKGFLGLLYALELFDLCEGLLELANTRLQVIVLPGLILDSLCKPLKEPTTSILKTINAYIISVVCYLAVWTADAVFRDGPKE